MQLSDLPINMAYIHTFTGFVLPSTRFLILHVHDKPDFAPLFVQEQQGHALWSDSMSDGDDDEDEDDAEHEVCFRVLGGLG